MTIALVFAVAENGVIGKGGTMPWHLPDDLRRFKELTIGHTVVMGRRTFQSIGRPLPDRRNIVLTRDRHFQHHGVEVRHNLADALGDYGRAEEVFVIGGADVFRQVLPVANLIYLTLVRADVVGDAVFTDLDWKDWALLEDQLHEADDRHEYSFSFRTYERRKEPAP